MTFGGQAGVGTSVETGELADEAVTNAKVSASAAIDLSKLATDPLARAGHTGTQIASTISDFAARVGDSTSTFTNKTFDANGTGNSISNIENADISATAAIALSKLA